MSGSPTADPRSQEIRALLADSGVALDESLDDDDSLIASGLLDSLALFRLVLWVEDKAGRAIDPAGVDLAREWDSIRLVLEYVDRAASRSSPAPEPAGPRRRVRHAEGALTIVPWGPDDKQAVARFQTGLWSGDPAGNLRYLEWKYEENPLGAEPRIYLAIERGEIVAMRGFCASRWELHGPASEAAILVADDLLVREDHRNRGLVHRLMQAALHDLAARGERFVLNLSGGPVTVLSSLASGWRSVGSLQSVRRRSWSCQVRSRLREEMAGLRFLWRYAHAPMLYGGAERHPFQRLDRLAGSVGTRGGVTVRVSREPEVRGMARLAAGRPRVARIRHVRSAAYLGWRLRNPRREYRFLYAGEEVLDGYLVLMRRSGDLQPEPRVSIVDLEASNDRTRAALLEVATRPGLFPELHAWAATLDSATTDCLARAGFAPVGRPARAVAADPCILVRPTEDARLADPWELHGIPLLEQRSWDLRMIDSMAG